MNEESLIWSTHEHEPVVNSANWYWSVGIITLAIVVIAILLDDALFGIVIGLGAILLGYHGSKEPRIVEIELGTKGVRVENKVYLYENLESFHLEKEVGDPKLVLKSKKFWMPYIILRAEGIEPEIIEEYLSQYLTESFHPEPILHKLLDKIGF